MTSKQPTVTDHLILGALILFLLGLIYYASVQIEEERALHPESSGQ